MSNELFNRGLKAHKSGDLNSAVQYYQKFLKIAPREYNALQLLGVVLHAKGDDENALKYMLASLKIKPDQPQVMLNVASCQRQLGLFDEALNTLNLLIKRDPANFSAFKSRMNVLVEMKNYQQAYKELSRQINQFPGHYELYNLLGAVATDSEDYTKAINAYQKAIQIRPGSDVARHNLGLAWWHSGEPEKALKEYQLVLNSGKHSYQLMHNMGNAYADIGHLEQAVTFFNNALKLNYSYLDTHINLNKVLWEMNDKKQFLRSFQKAMKLYPEDPAYLFQYARQLCKTASHEIAKAALYSKQAKFGELPEFKYLYGLCLLSTGEKGGGLSLLKSVSNHPKLLGDDHLAICRMLIKEKEFPTAERTLAEIRRAQPHDILATALWELCVRFKEPPDQKMVIDYPEVVREYRILDPNTDARFYNNLIETVSKMHAVKEKPLEQTLVNGTQTRGHLFRLNHPVFRELQGRIEKCVYSYVEELRLSNHQWLQLPDSKNFRFSGAWSSRLRKGGYHANHIHPRGKLSAIFYLALPKSVSNSRQRDGFLRFGEPDFESEGAYSVQHRVKPEIGKLVLFPSFCWHGTQAIDDEMARISISCDMI